MDEAVRHALAYPFALPDSSYLLDGEAVRRLGVVPDLAGRHGVLACGSNQSPDQLKRKFSGGDWGAIPVLEAWVDGLDAVYSAHYSRYGSIPATPVSRPGVSTRFFVTWLTEPQLARMHETEALGVNYRYGRIEGVRVEHLGDVVADHVHAYVSKWGCLDPAGPISLAEIDAQGRNNTVMDQPAVQEWARGRVAPDLDMAGYLAEIVRNEAVRRERTAALAALARQGQPCRFAPLAG